MFFSNLTSLDLSLERPRRIFPSSLGTFVVPSTYPSVSMQVAGTIMTPEGQLLNLIANHDCLPLLVEGLPGAPLALTVEFAHFTAGPGEEKIHAYALRLVPTAGRVMTIELIEDVLPRGFRIRFWQTSLDLGFTIVDVEPTHCRLVIHHAPISHKLGPLEPPARFIAFERQLTHQAARLADLPSVGRENLTLCWD